MKPDPLKPDPRKTIIIKPQSKTKTSESHETFLLILSGSPLGKYFYLKNKNYQIGRDSKCEISIDDTSISRTHAALKNENGSWILEDQESSNGIYVNFKKIKQYRLNNGDSISIGKTILKFYHTNDVEGNYYKEIYDLATMDGLTEVSNKRAFEDILKNEIKRSLRHHLTFSIIMLDLDHFKNINDQFGHPIGDFVLKGISGILKNNVRESDFIARFGGEEFIILLTLTKLPKAVALANRIRKKISEHAFNTEETILKITASLGVAEYKEEDTPESLIKRVDELLYLAKNSGRNRVYI